MAIQTDALTGEWLERARALAPVIAEFRDAGETQRMLPKPIFDALRQDGLFEMSTPKRFGGADLDGVACIRVIEELSRLDGGVGWNFCIGGSGGRFSPYLEPASAQEIFGSEERALIAGSFAPTGQASPEPGGHRLNGWSFASFCQQANWMVATAVMMEDGKPRMGPGGIPDRQLFFVPAEECRIIDTWHTAGLRGTGSHDYEISNAFVPEGRAFPFDELSRRPAGTDRRPSFFEVVIPSLAAVGLGIARDAIDSFKEVAARQTPRGGTNPLLGYHTVHEKVGRAEAMLGAARAYLYEVAGQVDSEDDGREVSDERMALVRLSSTYAAEQAAEVASMMFAAGGGSAVYETSRLERCFRDANVVTHHVMVQAMNFEMVGQYLLGLPLQMRR